MFNMPRLVDKAFFSSFCTSFDSWVRFGSSLSSAEAKGLLKLGEGGWKPSSTGRRPLPGGVFTRVSLHARAVVFSSAFSATGVALADGACMGVACGPRISHGQSESATNGISHNSVSILPGLLYVRRSVGEVSVGFIAHIFPLFGTPLGDREDRLPSFAALSIINDLRLLPLVLQVNT